jgi:D-galactarolactone cycloisomerase
LVGWGDVSVNGLNRQHLQDAAELLSGKDPRSPAPLVGKLSLMSSRIAAGVDVACSDIRGKAAGMSVAMLLGGPFRAAQPAYASLQNASESEDVAGAAVAEAEHAMSLGFTSLKMKIGWHAPAVDVEWINQVLATLPDTVPLAIDANRALDLAASRRIARGIYAPERIMWFEEPLSNRIPSIYRELRDSIFLPIAGAESIPFPVIREVITRRDMDIVNPDLVGHGGFERMQQLYALCETHGVRLVPHVFDGQLMRVATLHLLASWPDWEERQAGFTAAPLEVDISPNPLRDELLETPLRPNAEGLVPVPTGLGLGVVVNEDLVRRFGEST